MPYAPFFLQVGIAIYITKTCLFFKFQFSCYLHLNKSFPIIFLYQNDHSSSEFTSVLDPFLAIKIILIRIFSAASDKSLTQHSLYNKEWWELLVPANGKSKK